MHAPTWPRVDIDGMAMGEKHVWWMCGILVYMLWIRNLGNVGKTWSWHCSLHVCFDDDWDGTSGMSFGVPLSLYKERVFSVRERESGLRLRVAENGHWNRGYTIYCMPMYNLCYLIKFLVESSSIVYLSHK